MAFQSTVFQFMGAGVPGELYSNSPKISQSYIINSASAAYNVIGATAFSVTSQGVANAGNTGTQVYAGILSNPKTSAAFGTSNSPLSPTLTLNNYAQGELITVGQMWVTLPGTANIGDVVIFDNTTGALSTIAPGVSLPSGKSYAYGYVTYFTVTTSGSGLGVIQLNAYTPAVVQ
jgi:hypothetical protein